MNFNTKSFILALMVVAVLSTSTAEGSNQLRGADKPSIDRHLEGGTGALLTLPITDTRTNTNTNNTMTSVAGSSNSNGDTNACPVEMTLDSSQDSEPVYNGCCFVVGAECAYQKG